MHIGILRQCAGMRLVPLTPKAVEQALQWESTISVESGTGDNGGWTDDQYRDVGATVLAHGEEVVAQSDLVVTVDGSDPNYWAKASSGTVVVGLLKPWTVSLDEVKVWLDAGITAMSMDAIPRISRAQSMDVLSSLATVMGYRAVIVAAERLRNFFPLLMTAAGTIPPARVLVLGAGVAGLQAIATAHRLGAVVEAFDTRPEVKEQVESLGASFLSLDVRTQSTQDGYGSSLDAEDERRETDRLQEAIAKADVVITTAQIPGKPAPVLIPEAAVAAMRPGSVIIDLAAESGGNTAITKAGEEVLFHGVRVIGAVNLASELPHDASQLYSRNMMNFLSLLSTEAIAWDDQHTVRLPDDELVTRTTIIHQGNISHPGLQERWQRSGLHVAHR